MSVYFKIPLRCTVLQNLLSGFPIDSNSIFKQVIPLTFRAEDKGGINK